jgi:mono/diheme cytochrome c family protein
MRKGFTAVCASIITLALTLQCAFAATSPSSLLSKAHNQRISAADLAVSGDLAGLPAGSTLYLSREDLLTLPQVSFTVSDDPNFAGPTEISGVLLEELSHAIAGDSTADLVVAVCDDQYHANYRRRYLLEHHPLLVLKVGGQPPEQWPKDAEGYGQSMGPYMVSHRQFTPGFKILAHQDEPQIPWGVVGLELHNEQAFLAAIAPPRAASDPSVQAGYQIAQQNCLRCHNMGDEGGQKARHPWLVLSAWATAAPEHFAAYIRSPQAENPHAEMPASPKYDGATLRALTAYFRTFQSLEKP